MNWDVLMCMLVSWTNYYELSWGQAMLWMHWSQIYKIPTVYYRVGILHLLILAHGSMSPVTVRIVSLECKLLCLLGAWNKCCLWDLLLWMLPLNLLLLIWPVILEMPIYLARWFHNLVILRICNICESSSISAYTDLFFYFFLFLVIHLHYVSYWLGCSNSRTL